MNHSPIRKIVPFRIRAMKRASLLLLATLLIASCATATAGIAVSNIPLENRKYEILGPAETTINWVTFDMGIIGFPLEAPPVDEAVQEVLEQKGGDALINLRYWTDRSIIFFVTVNRFHLKADVVKLLD